MSVSDVSQIVLGVIAGFGGISGIIIFAVKACSNTIAERLSRKYQLQMDKELENYKNNLNKKNYISKVRFDLEIKIYQKLSEEIIQMVFENAELFPISGPENVPVDENEAGKIRQQYFEAAGRSFNLAHVTLKQNAPFIPKERYDTFSSLRDKCRWQLDDYVELYLQNKYTGNHQFVDENLSKEFHKKRNKCISRAKEINNQMNSAISELREYISGLDVLKDQ